MVITMAERWARAFQRNFDTGRDGVTFARVGDPVVPAYLAGRRCTGFHAPTGGATSVVKRVPIWALFGAIKRWTLTTGLVGIASAFPRVKHLFPLTFSQTLILERSPIERTDGFHCAFTGIAGVKAITDLTPSVITLVTRRAFCVTTGWVTFGSALTARQDGHASTARFATVGVSESIGATNGIVCVTACAGRNAGTSCTHFVDGTLTITTTFVQTIAR